LVEFTFKGNAGLSGWLGSLDCNIGGALRFPAVASVLESSGGLGDEDTGDKDLGGLCLKDWLRGIAVLKLGEYFDLFFNNSADKGDEGAFNGNGYTGGIMGNDIGLLILGLIDDSAGWDINGADDNILLLEETDISWADVSSEDEGLVEGLDNFLFDCFISLVVLFEDEFVVLEVIDVSTFEVFEVLEVISSEVSVGNDILLKSKSNITGWLVLFAFEEVVVDVWIEESWFTEGVLVLWIIELSLCELSIMITILFYIYIFLKISKRIQNIIKY